MVRIKLDQRFSQVGLLTGAGNPQLGNGWVRSAEYSHVGAATVSDWESDGSVASCKTESVPGAPTRGPNTQGHAQTNLIIPRSFVCVDRPLYHPTAPSIMGSDIGINDDFRIEFSMTFITPQDWPQGGTANLNDYMAMGICLFMPYDVSVPVDFYPGYEIFWVRDDVDTQELWGYWIGSTSGSDSKQEVYPDSRGLQLTGTSGRLEVLGDVDGPDKKTLQDGLRLKVVLYSVGDNNGQIGMDLYMDTTTVGDQLVASMGFTRSALQNLAGNVGNTQGIITSGQPAIEALRRRIGFWAYVNARNVSGDTDPFMRIKADNLIVRDLLADPEPAQFPEPTLAPTLVYANVAISGEGAPVGTMPLSPSFSETVTYGYQVGSIEYDHSRKATWARGERQRRVWDFTWGPMVGSDRDTIVDWWNTTFGQHETFDWTDDKDGTKYNVKAVTDITSKIIGYDSWTASARVIEVLEPRNRLNIRRPSGNIGALGTYDDNTSFIMLSDGGFGV